MFLSIYSPFCFDVLFSAFDLRCGNTSEDPSDSPSHTDAGWARPLLSKPRPHTFPFAKRVSSRTMENQTAALPDNALLYVPCLGFGPAAAVCVYVCVYTK